ncbi:DUF541 domain-containing protein [Patescibacteria group bacterium]|nr:MAG: DUF541 domain-containing protein [Patescibacteria group bacterium]
MPKIKTGAAEAPEEIREISARERQHYCCGAGFGKKIIMTLLGVLIVYAIFFLGTVVRNNIRKYNFIGKADKMERTISVNGYGKVTGSNNLAVTTIGFSNADKDIALAQQANKKVMDAALAELKKLGVDEKDLQSDYSVYPEYDYTEKVKQFKGYRVSHNVTVKIRDLTKVDKVLGLAGKYGVNEISGLTFTIDDVESLKDQARSKAVADAQKRAQVLAQSLGVKLVAMISYYESSGDYLPLMKYGAEGMGGGGMMPEVASGSKDVVVNASVTYEIAPR